MTVSFSFEDRFSYPSANGISEEIDKLQVQELSETELENQSPLLVEMASIIRSYSVLLQNTSSLELFNVITRDSDPRIALILASAKSKKTNQPLFSGLGAIREIMFADPNRPGVTGFVNRNLFSDGIRRVSCALTAARVIGQLAQITEQADHSKHIERQALDDLDRIVATWDLASYTETPTKDQEEEIPDGFFFEPLIMNLPYGRALTVEWQSPALSKEWTLVGKYETTVETWQIVNELSESINSSGTANPNNVLLAAPVLNGPYLTVLSRPSTFQYHALQFYPRNPLPGVFTYSINIRIQIVPTTQPIWELEPEEEELYHLYRSPFVWGSEPEGLNTYNTNGAMIIIRYNRLQAIRAEAEDYTPFVLYFRNAVDYREPDNKEEPPEVSTLTFRVQPWQPNLSEASNVDEEIKETVSISIPRKRAASGVDQATLDNNRFSQITLALSNALAELNLDSFLTSAIIRNDPPSSTDPMSGLELVSCFNQIAISGIVLDILEIPSDIELATGDRSRPLTTFSSKPRSAIVPTNSSSNGNALSDTVMKKDQAYVIPRRKPNLWQSIQDEAESIVKRGWSY